MSEMGKDILTVSGIIMAIAIFIAIIAWACSPSKKDLQSQVVEEINGCKVTRFYDAGHYHYFSQCKNTSVESRITYQCGKSICSRPETIETK